jgi:membrane protein
MDSLPAVRGVPLREFGHGIAERFGEAQGWEIAAALAYRLATAILPFLIFLTAATATLIELFGGEEPARSAVGQVDSILSDDLTESLEQHLQQLLASTSLVPLVAGFSAAMWTGATAGRSVVKHLNAIHGLEENRSRLRVYATGLGVSLISSTAAVLAFVVLLLGSLRFEPAAEALGISSYFGIVVDVFRWPIAFALLSGAAAAAYVLAPARDGGRRFAISSGALIFGVLWTIASGLLVFYAVNSGTLEATYGALTGLVVVLAWVYLTSVAFTLGAVVDAEMEARRV